MRSEDSSHHVESPAPRSWKWTAECWNVDTAPTGNSATATTLAEHVAAEFKSNCKTLFAWYLSDLACIAAFVCVVLFKMCEI